MIIDLHAKSYDLLESLANSIHDREPKNLNPFVFNIAEIQLAERWLEGFAKEVQQNAYEGGLQPYHPKN